MTTENQKLYSIYPQRYKITVEYIGTGFCGWQRQSEALSIQEVIENAIYMFTNEKITLYAAGRTDSGVNAYGQVCHFDLNIIYQPKKIMSAINHFCKPHKVAVISCDLVKNNFDARLSAKKRHYVYHILNRPGANIIYSYLKYWIRHSLNTHLMKEGANHLIGKHNFNAFRSNQCQALSAIKTIDTIKIIKNDDNIDIYVSALSFLHHMVRNIVGSLILVGKKKLAPIEMKNILSRHNTYYSGPVAPAYGLYLLKVDY